MKRVKSLDLLRVVGFSLIIYYHMIVQLQISGIYPIEMLTKFYEGANFHVATLAVALFFMISGAGLSLSTKEHFDYKQYYKKRFLRILIPFYLVYALTVLGKAFQRHSLAAVFSAISPWRFLFTITGLDGYLELYGVETFSMGVGEWFLGCILLLYVVYPFLRSLLQRSAPIFLILTTVVYVLVIIGNFSILPLHQNIILKGYEFCLGMFLGKHLSLVKSKCLFLTIPGILLFLLCPVALPVSEAFRITVLALSVFLTILVTEPYLQKRKLPWITAFSGASYELFLVHHVIICFLTPLAAPYIQNPAAVLVLFLIQILVMIPVTILVKFVSNGIISLLK